MYDHLQPEPKVVNFLIVIYTADLVSAIVTGRS